MQTQHQQPFWKVITAFGILLFCLNSLLFILFGQANADEGWYLYASRLVYSGQLPYRDFAFTQMPLLPYVYGLPQHFLSPGLYLGRITSVVFSGIAFFLSLQIARTYGGMMAVGMTSLLAATFTYGIYFETITKTYALTTFFFIFAIYIYSSSLKQEWKGILSSILLLAAILTRLTSLFFAVPFLLYSFVTGDGRVRWILIAISSTVLFLFVALAVQNMEAARWGLLSHHTSTWGQVAFFERITIRIPELVAWTVREFSGYALLWGAILLMNFNQVWALARRHHAILLTMIASALFLISSLISDGFQPDYVVPILFVTFPILGILCEKLYPYLGKPYKVLIVVMSLLVFAWGMVQGTRTYIDLSGGQPPIEELQQVADLVLENSDPGDKLFTFEALWLSIESGRAVLPGMGMAQFSFHEMDTDQARHLHLVNSEIVRDYIVQGKPKVIILTNLDEDILIDSLYYEDIRASLKEDYDLLFRMKDDFGHRREGVKLYVRRADVP